MGLFVGVLRNVQGAFGVEISCKLLEHKTGLVSQIEIGQRPSRGAITVPPTTQMIDDSPNLSFDHDKTRVSLESTLKTLIL